MKIGLKKLKKNIQQLTWKNLKTFKKEKLNENEELYEKYYSVVKNPLYFETIEKKLNMKPVPYKTYKEFVEQVNQIFKQEENVHLKYPTEFTLRWEDVKSIRNYFKLITDPLIKRNYGNNTYIEETNIEKNDDINNENKNTSTTTTTITSSTTSQQPLLEAIMNKNNSPNTNEAITSTTTTTVENTTNNNNNSNNNNKDTNNIERKDDNDTSKVTTTTVTITTTISNPTEEIKEKEKEKN